MGAYSLLSQRVSPQVAEQMMLHGAMHSSDELHKMGIVDVLVPKGEGVRAVHAVTRQNRRIASARLALHRVRDPVTPNRPVIGRASRRANVCPYFNNSGGSVSLN